MKRDEVAQIASLRRLADARHKRASAILAGAHQAHQRRVTASELAASKATEMAETADNYTRDRFLASEETSDTAHVFLAIAAGAAVARKQAAGAEMTSLRAQQREQDADEDRAKAALTCKALSDRIRRLEKLHEQKRQRIARQQEQMLEDEISETFGRD